MIQYQGGPSLCFGTNIRAETIVDMNIMRKKVKNNKQKLL
jgi:hypothetical protein